MEAFNLPSELTEVWRDDHYTIIGEGEEVDGENY